MKKKIILTTEQFIRLCENDDVLYTPNETNIPTLVNKVVNDRKSKGQTNFSLTFTKDIDAVNGVNDTEGLSINAGKGSANDVAKAKQDAQKAGVNPNKLNYTINVVNGKIGGLSENKSYTKKDLIDAKYKLIRENSDIFTKQELMEDFIGGLNPSQMRNMLDIYDDDELNAASDAVNRENLLSDICKDICETDRSISIYKGVFNFKTIVDIMKNHGFTYMGPYEEDESYRFTSDQNEIDIWPKYFYERPGAIHISNINIYEKGLNESVNLQESNSQIKRKYINYIYKELKDYTNKMYKDDNWYAVSVIYKKLQDMFEGKGEVEMKVEDGGYWKRMGEFPNYKEYLITIILNDGIAIHGSLKCHAAGTIEDTFKYYDITCTLW